MVIKSWNKLIRYDSLRFGRVAQMLLREWLSKWENHEIKIPHIRQDQTSVIDKNINDNIFNTHVLAELAMKAAPQPSLKVDSSRHNFFSIFVFRTHVEFHCSQQYPISKPSNHPRLTPYVSVILHLSQTSWSGNTFTVLRCLSLQLHWKWIEVQRCRRWTKRCRRSWQYYRRGKEGTPRSIRNVA